ncbi:MAG: PQQ-like beta-propeller repeat protein [Bacteroidia bacterium]|nr:PQQ-like beta-propeller repeat protein [Bacteroidia bacterium]
MIFILAFLPFISCKNINKQSPNTAQWRGAERSGVYEEKGLLKNWPAEGPKLLWSIDSIIGNGYGSPVITEDCIYIMGEVDSTGYLFAFDLLGKLKWKSNYGKEWSRPFPGSRCTPTVNDNLIYICSAYGRVVCFDMTGKQKWAVDIINDLHGRNNHFGISESVLVDEKNVYCMPGGRDTNVVALEKLTGKIQWVSKGMGEPPSYCSPIIISLSERSILVTFSMQKLLGIDIKDGTLLWSDDQGKEGDTQGNTPLYENYYGNHYIYYVEADGKGAVKLKLSKDGSRITTLWRNKDFGNAFGGFIKVNDFIYASAYPRKIWQSLDARSGQIVDSVKFNRGTTIFADSMLYCYNEKGEMGLMKPEPKKLQIICKFKVNKGTKDHFAHPVIHNGVLYIRHGKCMMAYDIKKGNV